MIFLVNRYFLKLCICFTLIGAGRSAFCSELELSHFDNSISLSEEEEQASDSETLPIEEVTIYRSLGPIYQRVYLYAFTAEMRHRVVVYVCRGLTPFEAINVILRTEQKKFEYAERKKTFTPGQRASLYKQRSLRKSTTG